ncbi:phage holin [Aminipila sp.]|uniref:phage holin n=1 Tax=Aminipila sp. TaxID=2060095 RepID=UPI001DF3CD2B|nr:phage holin [Aminipila sp.]MBE6035756.1 phage holin [Clostridiales bacterium]
MSKINWKLRLKNKTTLVSLTACIVAFVYQILAILNIVPAVTEETIMQLVSLLINLLVTLGVVVDPTTNGIKDSVRAMAYKEPN